MSTERETGFGPRYDVAGPLKTPDGRTPRVRTVWQIDHGQVAARLITAYPSEVRLGRWLFVAQDDGEAALVSEYDDL